MGSFVGLDIGSHTVKAIQLARKGENVFLFAAYRQPTLERKISVESQEDVKFWAAYLKTFFSEGRFSSRDVVVGLPESQVFTRVISVPKMSQAELRTAIKWEAEQYIPIPLRDVSMDYELISDDTSNKDNSKMEVLLVAAPLKLVKSYISILEAASLNPIGLETEGLAVARGALGNFDGPTTIIVNIGAVTTDLVIVSNKHVRFTRSISTGGFALARAVSQALGFEMDQAEQYKVTYGLDETQLEGKVMQAIKPIIDVIISDIKRSLSFYGNRYPDDSVKQAVICGGTASLPGLLSYLAGLLGLEVRLANSWEKISFELPKKSPLKKDDLPVLRSQNLSFTVAVGLALKEY